MQTPYFHPVSTPDILLLVNMSIPTSQPVDGYSGTASSAVRTALFLLRIITRLCRFLRIFFVASVTASFGLC